MKSYDLSEVNLKARIIIHCPEEEMARALFNELNKRNWTWWEDGVLDADDTMWSKGKINMCYELRDNNKITYGDVYYFQNQHIHITEFADLPNLSIIAMQTSSTSDIPKEVQKSTNSTSFSVTFPCEVGKRVFYNYKGEIHTGIVLSFTIGHTNYGNIVVEGNGYFKSIDLEHWNDIVAYNLEEIEGKIKVKQNY